MALVKFGSSGGGKSAPKNNKLQYKYKPPTAQQNWANLMDRMDKAAGSNTPQPDRWANNPNTQQYQNNYQRYVQEQTKKAQTEKNYNAYLEWITRNRQQRTDLSGAPRVRQDGYYYALPGQGYVPQPTAQQPAQQNYGGGSYAGGGSYGGGGGGGGSSYNPPLPEWWLNMTNWRI